MGKLLKYFVFLVVIHAQCMQSSNDDSDDYIKRPGVVDLINESKNKHSHPVTRDDHNTITHDLSEADLLKLIELSKAYTASPNVITKVHVVNYNPQIIKS